MASKYQGNKKKSGKSVKPVVVRDERAPVFLYTSVCCGELAKKEACVADFGEAFEKRHAALGHWNCSKCRKSCKVTRKINKDAIFPFSHKALALATMVADTALGDDPNVAV